MASKFEAALNLRRSVSHAVLCLQVLTVQPEVSTTMGGVIYGVDSVTERHRHHRPASFTTTTDVFDLSLI